MSALPATAPALPASGSSFYAAMRILPREQRDAMYAIYSFCRAVDDIADEPGPKPERFAALETWRQDIDRMIEKGEPVAIPGLQEWTRRFGMRRDDFHAVIDGMAMDLAADMHAPDWATLDLYCERVASAVGRLSNRVFGLPDAEGDELAHHLGRALQLTNILRDVDEDAGLGRLYLPREELLRAGIDPDGKTADDVLADPRLGVACAAVAARARNHFEQADRIMSRCSRSAVRAPRMMEAAYRGVLKSLLARGWAPPRERVRVNKLRLVPALLRYGIA
jgi:phytoene synthase